MGDPILPEFIAIPAGRTLIGSIGQNKADEQPATLVDVPAFCIAATPVTAREFYELVKVGGAKPRASWGGLRPPSGKEDHPVTNCSWRDANAYCRWLSTLTGYKIYLPSEAEWERAARADMGLIWPWGDDFSPSRANTHEAGRGTTTSVYAHPDGASPFGLLDMAGNVWEWTRDVYQPYPYTLTNLPIEFAGSTSEDRRRVLRGGSWMADADYARCSARTNWHPNVIFSGQVGFRIACKLNPMESIL